MRKSALFFILLCCCATALIARLYYVQIYHKIYGLKGNRTAVMPIRRYPSRGYIYDRNGKVLAANKNSYNLLVIPGEIAGVDTTTLCHILQLSKGRFEKRIQRCIQKNTKYRKAVFERLLSPEKVAQLQELSYKFPGFYLQRNSLRTYPHITSANVLGYIGEANARFLASHATYQAGENTGITGIEKSYERYLRGKPGISFVRKDVHNRITGHYKDGAYDTLPQPGEGITATIDLELQEYGERLMRHKRGSIVAIEPKTGEILALVTSPSYDPNLLVGKQKNKNYYKLQQDNFNRPLLDRSIIGAYPPGSLFKIVTALIGEQEGVLTAQTTYICHHGFHVGHFHIGCHGGSKGPIHLKTAIAKSCNNFFARVYWAIIRDKKTSALGLEAWSHYAKSFGFGNFLHDDLSTGRKGYIPDSSFYDKRYGRGHWNALNTISNGIGQGEVLTTPLQIANLAAIMANRGWYYPPHIVQKIGGRPNTDPALTQKKRTLIAERHFKPVIDAMQQVIDKGTGKYTAKIPGITLCGKTGTAQNPHGQEHSTFLGFAPKEHPVIAVGVVVENGYWGSRWAAPIASLMVEKYINGAIETPGRKAIEKRMMEGDLRPQYEKQRLAHLKAQEAASATSKSRASRG